MRKIFRIYKPFTHAGILLAAQYRVNFIFFLLGDILMCFINYFLWRIQIGVTDTEIINFICTIFLLKNGALFKHLADYTVRRTFYYIFNFL